MNIEVTAFTVSEKSIITLGLQPRVTGLLQHLGDDSLDCCTEKYEIIVLLPNSEHEQNEIGVRKE